MMIATVGGGVFMFFVHYFSRKIPPAEYSAFGTLLQVLNWMSIPALGLQMVIAQQTSAAISDDQKHQLAGTIKAVLKWTLGIWLVMAAVALACNQRIIAALQLSNPAALWITLFIGLTMLWQPIFQGLLQGRQNFLWLGWVGIFNGVGRVVIGGFIVYVLHGWAAGLLAGVLIGLVSVLLTGVWQNRDVLSQRSSAFDAVDWLKRVVPITIGFGASQFLFSADAIVVQNYLGEGGQAAPYIFGGTLARAIVLFTGPLAAVMFPKLVHSAARSQKSDLMGLTLLGTAALGCMAAIGLTITAPLLIKYGSNPDFVSIVPLIPLFAWSMVPLAVGNVLMNNLMAHSRFQIVPVLAVLAIGYWVALQHFHADFRMVVKTFGTFTSIYFGVCAVFTWVIKPKSAAAPAA